MSEYTERLQRAANDMGANGRPVYGMIVREAAERIESLEAQLSKAQDLLSEIVRIHADSDSPNYNECDLEGEECMWCNEAKQLMLRAQGGEG